MDLCFTFFVKYIQRYLNPNTALGVSSVGQLADVLYWLYDHELSAMSPVIIHLTYTKKYTLFSMFLKLIPFSLNPHQNHHKCYTTESNLHFEQLDPIYHQANCSNYQILDQHRKKT